MRFISATLSHRPFSREDAPNLSRRRSVDAQTLESADCGSEIPTGGSTNRNSWLRGDFVQIGSQVFRFETHWDNSNGFGHRGSTGERQGAI
jgi:hypothetical protein